MNEQDKKDLSYAIDQIHTAADICNWAAALPFVSETEAKSLELACSRLVQLKERLEDLE